MSVHKEKNSYLKRCVNSILNQTFQNFEFIIIADATSAENIHLLKEFSRMDKRILLHININNLGLTKSLNVAANLAKGNFIARIDSDDFSESYRLEEQLKFLVNNPDYCLCGSKSYEVYENETFQQHTDFYETNVQLKDALFKMNPFTHSTLMVTRKSFKNIGYYDEQFYYAQDYKLVCDLKDHGKFYNLPKPLTTRHMDPTCISFSKNIEQLKCSIKVRVGLIKSHGTNLQKLQGLTSILKSLLKICLIRLNLSSALPKHFYKSAD